METVRDVTRRFGGDLKDVKRDIAGFGRDVRNKFTQPVTEKPSTSKLQDILRSPRTAINSNGFLPTSGRDFEQLVNYDSDEDETKESFRIEDFELLTRGKRKDRFNMETPFTMETLQDTLRNTERELDSVMRKADKGVDAAVRKTGKAFRIFADSASRSSQQVVGKLKSAKPVSSLKVFP